MNNITFVAVLFEQYLRDGGRKLTHRGALHIAKKLSPIRHKLDNRVNVYTASFTVIPKSETGIETGFKVTCYNSEYDMIAEFELSLPKGFTEAVAHE